MLLQVPAWILSTPSFSVIPSNVRPPTMRKGQTVADVAGLVHKDLARSLRSARVWGRAGSADEASESHELHSNISPKGGSAKFSLHDASFIRPDLYGRSSAET